jgi:dienelactone hydrolase
MFMRLKLSLSIMVIWLQLTQPVFAAEPPLLILMPGGSGVPKANGFLVRNKHEFDRAGFETLISSTAQTTIAAARSAKAEGRKVFIAGISLGVARSATALASGAEADAAVFYSGAYQMARTRLGSPRALPPTLIVHHRDDSCPVTTPRNVEPFRRWSNGKIVRTVWLTGSRNPQAWACGPMGAHGFFGQDGKAISTAINFLKRY